MQIIKNSIVIISSFIFISCFNLKNEKKIGQKKISLNRQNKEDSVLIKTLRYTYKCLKTDTIRIENFPYTKYEYYDVDYNDDGIEDETSSLIIKEESYFESDGDSKYTMCEYYFPGIKKKIRYLAFLDHNFFPMYRAGVEDKQNVEGFILNFFGGNTGDSKAYVRLNKQKDELEVYKVINDFLIRKPEGSEWKQIIKDTIMPIPKNQVISGIDFWFVDFTKYYDD